MRWGYTNDVTNGNRKAGTIIEETQNGPVTTVATVGSSSDSVSEDAMMFKVGLDKHRREETEKRKAEFYSFINDVHNSFDYTTTKITDISSDAINVGKKAVNDIIKKIKFW